MPELTEGSPRPTLEAVAARAGVSRATVSRVVNGGEGVRRPLVDRVRKAVQELGYVPNHAARSLVTRRHGAVAVIIAEPEFRIFSDPFFEKQVRGISRELTARDTQLVLLWVEGTGDHERIARYLDAGHVDGALAFSLHSDDRLPALIARSRVPVVFGGRPALEPGLAVPFVDCDNRGGARAAVQHLVSLGRRRIGHIAGPRNQTSALDRIAGYQDVLVDADPALLCQGDFTSASGARAMAELLERRPDLDAVFAANDLMAAGALRTLRDHGIRVPEDVAVVGFDDMDAVVRDTVPALTTVRQDIEGMGRLMVRLLMRVLDVAAHTASASGAESVSGAAPAPGAGAASVITPTSLVRRVSA
ncbi:LacI family DNA-binding transcriptional regulator [Streptomyces sp. NPDC089799]|uniref:LacI family DNA-binding transcriptional regulator n=1 Tax=Streptomyces sp. NPDC089799 TaxID=3155066 RepID=UPI00341F9E8B